MKFLSVENEVDQAIQMVNSDESTDPKVVTEVANYKEELEKLKSQDGGEDTSSTGSDEPSSETGEGAAENSASGEGSDDTGSDDEGGDDEGESESDKSSEEPSEEVTDEDVKTATEAFHIVSAIETINCKLLKLRNKGGTDEVTIKMALECSDLLARRVGFRLVNKNTIALESGDNYTARRNNIVAAMESISQTAKDIWEAIKRFFKTMYNWIKEYIFGVKQVTRTQEDAVKEIKDSSKNIHSKLSKTPLTEESLEKLSKVYFKQSAANLTVTNEGTPETVLGSSKDVMQFCSSFLDTEINIYKSKIYTAIAALQKTDPNIRESKIFIDESDYSGLKVTQLSNKGVAPGLIAMSTEVLPGKRYLSVVCPQKNVENAKIGLQSSITLERTDGHGGSNSQISVITDSTTITKVEGFIEELLKLKINFTKSMEGPFNNGLSDINQLLAMNMSNWKNLNNDVLMVLQQDTKDALQKMLIIIERPMGAIIKYIELFVNALLEYLVYSQKQILKVLEAQIKAQPASQV